MIIINKVVAKSTFAFDTSYLDTTVSIICNLFLLLNTIFSEDCPKNILVPYLPEIMGKLESVLKAKAGIK